MDFIKKLDKTLKDHQNVLVNLERKELIRHSVANKEVFRSNNGALVSITPPHSTGRSPKDTYVVKRKEMEADIDWDSPNNIPLDPETFEMILEDALAVIGTKQKLYITNRVIGADSSYALPVKTVASRATTALFTDNMFRPRPKDIEKSVFADKEFILLTLPYDKLDREKYKGRLRTLPNGLTSDIAVAMDFVKGIGIVYGSAYLGSNKKLMFTVMDYLLPGVGILPLHCSANEGADGDIAVFAGLSGTGKTTLSSVPNRKLLGDDEHGWSDDGIANFENGCYAKLIKLNPKKEPEIHDAITRKTHFLNHGAIVENAML
ncbi:MAG: phosphoenolpyruvate carboxykinase (ATP), partial [bacterium]|nr:phosphoenolpyruvate carboxykinase (ATP) [bacterium]